MTRGRWLPTLLLALLALAFARANRGETMALHLGPVTFYRAPVSVVVLGAFLLGMVAMFLLGLRHDLRVRRLLRERLPADATAPFPNHYGPADRV